MPPPELTFTSRVDQLEEQNAFLRTRHEAQVVVLNDSNEKILSLQTEKGCCQSRNRTLRARCKHLERETRENVIFALIILTLVRFKATARYSRRDGCDVGRLHLLQY